MGYISMKSKKPSEQEIDAIVVSEANDDSKWTKPVLVHPKKSVPVFLTPKTAEKLKNAARKQHVKDYHKWVNKIVEQHLTDRV